MYLVTLRFRAYPLSFSLSSPNELSQELMPLDGPLAFAEYYRTKLSHDPDWRIKYLEDVLTARELEWVSNIRSSYLLPCTVNEERLTITTPMGFKVVFNVNGEARYEFSERQHPKKWESSQIFLRLGRRDDIIKVEILRNSLGVSLTKRTKGLPSSQSGPYKAVDYSLRLYTPNLMWASIVDGISQRKLRELLYILRKFGVGKKRNMGWGDLLEYHIYELKSRNITSSYILHAQGESRFLETWRPISPEKIAGMITKPPKGVEYNRLSLLDSKIGYGAERPPYWRRNLVVKSALFLAE
ncbi:hypothetical protein [Thermococcus pacificus]|uniref:CRISPR system Cms protein Csm4 n=1 Tax=Thermococcus pacificus TaxID=71998 RepID=A0A218P7D0_9EURY|nr:hypothetical protein [Thermococcus pacificus]ASJ06670.1 hypothetical protein A3L08_04695 [Thermococcus pacificus]